MSIDRERLIYPDVLASTKPGDIEVKSTGHYFAEAVTNNHDTVIRTIIYWYIPEDGGEPVLVIEIDDEEATGWFNDFMDVRVRIRRNDGLIYEGNRAEQESMELEE
jgi:hypothetical protein